MNNQMRELYRLASNADSVDSEESLIEKFAELMIQECAKRTVELGQSEVGQILKQHFGIQD